MAVTVTTHAMTRTMVGGGSYRLTIARVVVAAAILCPRARDGRWSEDKRTPITTYKHHPIESNVVS